jgi:hypothetical protein
MSIEQLLIISSVFLSLKSQTFTDQVPFRSTDPHEIQGLPSKAQLFYDIVVSVDIDSLQIIQKPSSLTNQFQKTTPRMMIFLVDLKVIGKIVDAIA